MASSLRPGVGGGVAEAQRTFRNIAGGGGEWQLTRVRWTQGSRASTDS